MRAHVPLGFDVTAPISCLSSSIPEIEEVFIYVPQNKNPKSQEAINALMSYLRAVGKSGKVIEVNPCSKKTIMEMALNLSDRNLICGGSGFRAIGIELTLACLFTKSNCLLRVSLEAGGPCLEMELKELWEGDLGRNEAIALAYAIVNGKVSPSELEELGMGRKTAWRVLNNLIDKGYLVKVERGRYAPRASSE
ncbi:hypothetical protein IPA_06795 [Ignicoccus pacificus DSM 13166]|uniref:Csa3 N-terminal domain-containing protein n=1 Tax=Ignicoccus pacificus DSM 13166 TaxID=940294 RepID=A0A977KBM9_9CREN|nr:hypothetical protein IPA_06795 [Ignicoccus pacificus DSM 13166]